MKIYDFLENTYKAFLDTLFPLKCCSCGILTNRGEYICNNCRRMLPYIDIEKRCKFCGKEKEDCDCNSHIRRYNEIVATFKYSDTARNTIIRLKHGGRSGYAAFLAREMALVINETYRNIKFDYIMYVPTSRTGYRKRGYNQAKLIASKLSKLFRIPLCHYLKIKENRTPQHKATNRNERFINSRNKYISKGNLSNKTILLIDDVSTTGATLDDATRALLFAGADSVYCAVAAITSQKRKEK